MWTLHKQPQHCGAQLPARERNRQPGEPPAVAVDGREAQDHDLAGETLQPGEYPASAVENGGGGAPSAPDAQQSWDAVVQPERPPERELDEDQRGEDAEATVAVEQQQEQAQPSSAGVGETPRQPGAPGEGAERFDRND